MHFANEKSNCTFMDHAMNSIMIHIENIFDTSIQEDVDWKVPFVVLTATQKNMEFNIHPIDINDDVDNYAKQIRKIIMRNQPDFAAVVVPLLVRRIHDNQPLADLSRDMIKKFGIDTDPLRQEAVAIMGSDYDKSSCQMFVIDDSGEIPRREEWQPLDVYNAQEMYNFLMAVPQAFVAINQEERHG